MSRKPFQSFWRSQIAAGIATTADFLIMIVIIEFALGMAAVATAVGAATGGVVNFLLGRGWAFRAGAGAVFPQAIRYAMVSSGSLALNVFGMWFFVDWLDHPYFFSRVAISLVVAVAFNFPLQRYFVFSIKQVASETSTALK